MDITLLQYWKMLCKKSQLDAKHKHIYGRSFSPTLEIINKKLDGDVCYSVKRPILKKEEKVLVNDIDKKIIDKIKLLKLT